MGTAYTPGLKVTRSATVTKVRKLPIKGETTVEVNQKVEPDTVVARAHLPGELHTVKIAEKMGLEPVELEGTLQVEKGDKVTKEQVLAMKKTFFGLLTSRALSPIDGTVEYFAPAAGHMGIREPDKLLEVDAYIRGTITEIFPGDGVAVTAHGALVQGIFGIGGERIGTIKLLASSPDEPLTPEKIPSDCSGLILVGGAVVTADALRRTIECGGVGVIVGGIVNEDLADFLGYDIGVAITGTEDINLTLVVTEGFGQMTMAVRTFNLFKELEGKEASFSGATQIRAGAVRPEIIVPLEEEAGRAAEESVSQLIDIGTHIRIIRVPYFGMLAEVTALPPELKEIATGSKVRMLKAKLSETGETVAVPRANVEIIGA
jgi:hypothetical protein